MNTEQIKDFFESLRQKHATGQERPSVRFTLIDGRKVHSGADLAPELLRDFSDWFSIPIDALRTCSFDEIELLMLEAFTTAREKDIPSLLHIPFGLDQNLPKEGDRQK